MLDKGSLTQRLIDQSKNNFSVEVYGQQLAAPRLDESNLLNLAYKRAALVREVFLCGNNQPWVFARSIIPQSTLTGRLRALRHLDNRPLGAVLFSDPTMTRGPMEIARIPAAAIPDNRQDPHATLWGRRSVFYLDNKPLLVSEIFLSAYSP